MMTTVMIFMITRKWYENYIPHTATFGPHRWHLVTHTVTLDSDHLLHPLHMLKTVRLYKKALKQTMTSLEVRFFQPFPSLIPRSGVLRWPSGSSWCLFISNSYSCSLHLLQLYFLCLILYFLVVLTFACFPTLSAFQVALPLVIGPLLAGLLEFCYWVRPQHLDLTH